VCIFEHASIHRRISYGHASQGHIVHRYTTHKNTPRERVSHECVSCVCLIGIRLKVIYFMDMHLYGSRSAKTPTASSRSSEIAPELARRRQPATFLSRRMCTQILVKPGPFLDPRSILGVARFWVSGRTFRISIYQNACNAQTKMQISITPPNLVYIE
jgi:hypothetical protein